VKWERLSTFVASPSFIARFVRTHSDLMKVRGNETVLEEKNLGYVTEERILAHMGLVKETYAKYRITKPKQVLSSDEVRVSIK